MTFYVTDLSAETQAKPVLGPSPLCRPVQKGVYRTFFKRTFDLALVILTAPFTVPLILFLTLLVATDGSRPFYTQLRVGRNGRTFRMWKLRTMVPNADRILEAYCARRLSTSCRS